MSWNEEQTLTAAQRFYDEHVGDHLSRGTDAPPSD